MNTCRCLNLILACIVYCRRGKSPRSSGSATRSPQWADLTRLEHVHPVERE
jgi:hypothetical protein